MNQEIQAFERCYSRIHDCIVQYLDTTGDFKLRAEQDSGLNDYPPSRVVLGRFAPGTSRAVGKS